MITISLKEHSTNFNVKIKFLDGGVKLGCSSAPSPSVSTLKRWTLSSQLPDSEQTAFPLTYYVSDFIIKSRWKQLEQTVRIMNMWTSVTGINLVENESNLHRRLNDLEPWICWNIFCIKNRKDKQGSRGPWVWPRCSDRMRSQWNLMQLDNHELSAGGGGAELPLTMDGLRNVVMGLFTCSHSVSSTPTSSKHLVSFSASPQTPHPSSRNDLAASQQLSNLFPCCAALHPASLSGHTHEVPLLHVSSVIRLNVFRLSFGGRIPLTPLTQRLTNLEMSG